MKGGDVDSCITALQQPVRAEKVALTRTEILGQYHSRDDALQTVKEGGDVSMMRGPNRRTRRNPSCHAPKIVILPSPRTLSLRRKIIFSGRDFVRTPPIGNLSANASATSLSGVHDVLRPRSTLTDTLSETTVNSIFRIMILIYGLLSYPSRLVRIGQKSLTPTLARLWMFNTMVTDQPLSKMFGVYLDNVQLVHYQRQSRRNFWEICQVPIISLGLIAHW